MAHSIGAARTDPVDWVQLPWAAYRVCARGTAAVQRVPILYAGYSFRGAHTESVRGVQPLCSAYRSCTPGTASVGRTQSLCERYSRCAARTDPVRRVQLLCIGYRFRASSTPSVRHVQTRYQICRCGFQLHKQGMSKNVRLETAPTATRSRQGSFAFGCALRR